MKITGNLNNTTNEEITLREKLLIGVCRKLDNAGSNDIIKALAFGQSVTTKVQKRAVRKVGHKKIAAVRKLFYKKIK